MEPTTLKELFAAKGVKFGCGILEVTTPGIGQILKAAGCDYAFVDMEHSGFAIDTVKQVLRYMQAAGLPAFVRPPSKAYHHIARCLDAGAEGLMLPMVGSADEARTILARMKYPPIGVRGVALGIAHDRYRAGPAAARLRQANDSTVCIALIETVEGVANAAEIAAVPGVDALWIGHFDLSCSLGVNGQFKHRKFRAAVARVRDAAKRRGLPIGRLTENVNEGRALVREGFDLICYGTDIGLLRQASADGIKAIRKGNRS